MTSLHWATQRSLYTKFLQPSHWVSLGPQQEDWELHWEWHTKPAATVMVGGRGEWNGEEGGRKKSGLVVREVHYITSGFVQLNKTSLIQIYMYLIQKDVSH